MKLIKLLTSYFSGGSWLTDANEGGLSSILNELITRITPTIATWDYNKVRYFFVDGLLGDDDNDGYIDGVPGSIFTPAQTGPVAIKTLNRLAEILPRIGNFRMAKVLIAAGTYTDDLDVGQWGYRYLGFHASNLTNDVNDRIDMAGQIDVVGPNFDGSFTIQSRADNSFTLVGGATGNAWEYAGRRMQFKGNVTPGMRTRAMMVVDRPSANVLDSPLKFAGWYPEANDEFFLMKPSVFIPRTKGNPSHHNYNGTTNFQEEYWGVTIAGIHFTDTTTWHFPSGRWLPIFCRFSGAFSWNYYDATSFVGLQTFTAAPTPDGTIFCAHSCTFENGVYFGACPTFFQFWADIGANSYIEVSDSYSAAFNAFYMRSGSFYLSVCKTAAIGLNPFIAPPVIDGNAQVRLWNSQLRIYQLKLRTSGDGLRLEDKFTTAWVQNFTGTCGGDLFDLSSCEDGKLVLGNGNTATPTGVHIRVVGATRTLTEMDGAHLVDEAFNTVQGAGAIKHFYEPAVTADPSATPPPGYILRWFRSDTNQASVKKSDGNIVRETFDP